jgi:hypothetical protein
VITVIVTTATDFLNIYKHWRRLTYEYYCFTGATVGIDNGDQVGAKAQPVDA